MYCHIQCTLAFVTRFTAAELPPHIKKHIEDDFQEWEENLFKVTFKSFPGVALSASTLNWLPAPVSSLTTCGQHNSRGMRCTHRRHHQERIVLTWQ